jgi:hypothetical protein
MMRKLRPWQSTVEMTRDQLSSEICMLRSENTNLRRHLDRYRSMVTGMRGAITTVNAVLELTSETESEL